MQKIVFFDIDGTLVTTKNELPESTRKAISQLKENGHIPIISTGRPPKMLAAVSKALGINSYISLNGQYIVCDGTPIFTNPLPTGEIERLIETSYENNERAFLLTKDKVIGNTFMGEMIEDPEFLTFVYTNLQELSTDVTLELFTRMTEKPLVKERYEKEEILSAFLHTNEKEEAYYQERFPALHFTRATPYMSEVLMKGAHKAAGMGRMVKHLGLTMADTVAFGDGLNDLEMIEAAGIGVSMGNGRDELKKKADYVTSHVEDEGIFKGLTYLNLI